MVESAALYLYYEMQCIHPETQTSVTFPNFEQSNLGENTPTVRERVLIWMQTGKSLKIILAAG